MEKAKDRNKHPHDNQICLSSKEGAIIIYDVPRLNQKKLRPVSPYHKYLSTSPIYQPNLQQRHHRKSTVSGFSFSIWPAKSKINVIMLLDTSSYCLPPCQDLRIVSSWNLAHLRSRFHVVSWWWFQKQQQNTTFKLSSVKNHSVKFWS